jgi:pentapeptide MXKDX repeat protein
LPADSYAAVLIEPFGRHLLSTCNFPTACTSHLCPFSRAIDCKEKIMNKIVGKLMAMCVLAVSLSGFAQSSGGEMKHDDNMKQDSMKHDDMKKDEMKKDKKAKKSKKDQMKKDEMKDDKMKDENMKHDDMKKN